MSEMFKAALKRCAGAFLGVIVVVGPLHAQYKLSDEAKTSWGRYTELTERRIETDLKNPSPMTRKYLESVKKDVQTKQLTSKDNGKSIPIKDSTIHHWHGAIFVSGIRLEPLLAWLQEYDRYTERFKKEIEQSELRSRAGDTFNIRLGLTRTKLFVTVHYDTEHTVVYRRHVTGRASSRSEATKIVQLKEYGTPDVRRLPEGNDDGYLWRLNSYWTFTEFEDGVIVECESIGLSRPLGSFLSVLNFFAFGRIKAIASDVARESMEDTLKALRDGARDRR